MVTFDLPYPPTVNLIWRHFRGRTVLSKAGRLYRSAVAGAVLAQRVPAFGTDRLKVSLLAHMPDARKRDIDNINKACLDAMQAAGLFADDSQIKWLLVCNEGIDRDNPRITVHMESIE